MKGNRFNLFYNPLDVEGECLLKQIRFIKKNTVKFVLHIILSIITLGNLFTIIKIGIPRLLMFWYPQLQRYYYFDYVDARHQATHFWINNYDDQVSIVEKDNFRNFYTERQQAQTIGFTNRYLKYYLDERDKVRAIKYNVIKKILSILNQQQQTRNYKGLSVKDVQNLKKCYGPGAMLIKKQTLFELFIHQIFRPMFLFVIYSIIVWFWTEYYYYVGIIILSLVITLVINLYQSRILHNKIHSMAYYQTELNVLRQGQIVRASSLDIVPGDIVFFKDTEQSNGSFKIPFDGKILDGSLLINQCSLTGQSVPVVKKACKNLLNLEHDRGSQIFQGTSIIQVNCNTPFKFFQKYRQAYGVPVCVHKTNFYTTKGGLIRIIQFPKQQQNLFQKQSSKYLIFVFIFTWITYGILALMHSKQISFIMLLQKSMDIVTISVPPALPVSMTLGIIYAVQKLQAKNIFCTSQNNIIKGGSVQHICFDKTGTLTELYMDFFGVLPYENGRFQQLIKNRDNMDNQNILDKFPQIKSLKTILYNFGSNHSLIQNLKTKEIIGDPMELKTFQFGDFKFDYKSGTNADVSFSFKNHHNISGQVYKVFEFDSQVQRMSVICKTQDDQCYLFTKGSPQVLKNLFDPRTINTKQYDEQLKKYSSMGYRILAIGSKKIDFNLYQQRIDLESNLHFQGFTIFQNMLKPQSHGAILQLKQADILCSMITGDSPLTACCIGLQCQIADRNKKILIFDKALDTLKYQQFNSNQKQNTLQTYGNPSQVQAIVVNIANKYPQHQICLTGNIFAALYQRNQTLNYSEELKKLFMRTSIFARAKPNQKAKIISIYQSFGKIMGMCGDGANDCGALKQAQIGLSLSETQASISAPFTSKIFNIEPMVQLIKECRAGLATNFSLFNIMSMYSFIQYTTAWICQYYYAYPSDLKFVYWDFVGNFLLLITYGYIGTADKLTKQKPLNSLFRISNIFQILSMVFIQLVGQIVCIQVTKSMFAEKIDYYANGGVQRNIEFYNKNNAWVRDSTQVNVLFLFTNLFYSASFVGFSIENPWRKRFYTCWPFLIIFILVLGYSSLIILVPGLRFPFWKLDLLKNNQFLVFIFALSAIFSWILYANQKYILEPVTNYLRKTYEKARQIL